MKAIIITLALIVCSLVSFGQTKALKEKTGFCRIHKVDSFRIDTTYNEDGTVSKITKLVQMKIYREGIDGAYDKEVSNGVYGNADKTIDELFTKPEYKDFTISELQ